MPETAVHSSADLTVATMSIGRLIQIVHWHGITDEPALWPFPPGAMDLAGRTAFSPGPGRMVLYSPHADDWPDLSALVANRSGCATDLSHSRAAYAMTGHGAARFLQSLVAIDLSERSFPTGRGCATVHHDTPVFLFRSGAHVFHSFVARSLRHDFEMMVRNVAQGLQ